MADDRLIWPSQLHHICLGTEDVPAMVDWYQDIMEMAPQELEDGGVWMRGRQRNIILRPGQKGQIQYVGLIVSDETHLARMRDHLAGQDITLSDDGSPLFEAGAFSFSDPDGNRIMLGLAKNAETGVDPRPGWLQHIVFATTDLERAVAFYTDKLGFKLSDIVREEDSGEHTACFLRCDDMHHTMAFFRSDSARLDHFANEASCWNDIRDWGDHFAAHHVEIVWGAGRHGAGNNLFIFVRDPDENNVEISAELETFSYDREPRFWAHDNRPLNLWGHAWMRS